MAVPQGVYGLWLDAQKSEGYGTQQKRTGMEAFLKLVYVNEIRTQCQFALSAVFSLNQAVKQVAGDGEACNSEVFRQIHSFLTHVSNVSLLFWPQVPKQRDSESEADYQARISPKDRDRLQRGICLRKLFEVDGKNCLKDRKLRNHLEHYDERLDEWRRTSTSHFIASDIIGPLNAVIGPSITDRMRWYDPLAKMFHFRGENYDIQELATAIDRLLALSVSQAINLEKELRESKKSYQ